MGGTKTFDYVKDKIVDSSNHFVRVVKDSDLEIDNFICCFLGKYKNPKLIKKRKKVNIKITGLNKHNIKIHNFPCGYKFEKLLERLK